MNQVLKKKKRLLFKINHVFTEDDEVILNSSEIKKEIIKIDYNNKIKNIVDKYREYYKILFN